VNVGIKADTPCSTQCVVALSNILQHATFVSHTATGGTSQAVTPWEVPCSEVCCGAEAAADSAGADDLMQWLWDDPAARTIAPPAG